MSSDAANISKSRASTEVGRERDSKTKRAGSHGSPLVEEVAEAVARVVGDGTL